MTTRELLEVVSEPFEGFRITMTDGATFDVTDPRWFRVGAKTSYVFVPSLAYPEAIDYQVRLSNAHIAYTTPLGTIHEHQARDAQ